MESPTSHLQETHIITRELLEHEHPLELIDLQPNYPHYDEEYDDEDDSGNNLIAKQDFPCACDRCGQEINLFHRYYYKCSDSCNFSLHKFCAELPATLNHASHQAHILILLQRKTGWRCNICRSHHEPHEIRYRCYSCDFDVDLKCSGVFEEEKFHHPSHPHTLVPTSRPILCECDACGKRHTGKFYQCITCSIFYIHSDCAFLPKTLLVQQTTKDVFSHTHPLTLSYSFPEEDQDAKFNPRCRICGTSFEDENLWIYKCDECRYYAHLDCATSRGEKFMSIFLSARTGKTVKNFEDIDHPDLLHLPFPDQSCSLLKHLFFKKYSSRTFETNEGILKHICHQHPLVLVDTQCNDITRPTSSINSLSCHNPMKKIELLCNGCIRPITTMPFYMCNNEGQGCKFVLHEWCTQLPAEVQNHPMHPQHALILLPNIPDKFLDVFTCDICQLPCNGFVYSCVQCDYHIGVECGFIPEKITHEAHPNHLLQRVQTRPGKGCLACLVAIGGIGFSFSCLTCDFDLHPHCALLLPQTIRHKYDKHPMHLSYFPIENHKAEYFCEICEEEFDPELWFYHCKECVQSMHSACAPLIVECETTTYKMDYLGIYRYMNVKFGGIHNIENHPHPLSFVQGIESDGWCAKCDEKLKYQMILKCFECKFAIGLKCCESWSN